MDVKIKNVDIDDIDKFNGAGMNVDLSDHYKLIVTDDVGNSGYLFIPITLSIHWAWNTSPHMFHWNIAKLVRNGL